MKVYILHHSNPGTPESGEIESVHATMAEAKAAMKKELIDTYESSLSENKVYDYMYISTHTVKSKK